jgi:hypothetical protein
MNFLSRKKSQQMSQHNNEEPGDHEGIPQQSWARPELEPEFASFPRDLDTAPYAPKEPLPTYVSPRSTVPPVGALSAEALLRDYEKTAKQVENMGAELAGATHKCAEELNLLAKKYDDMVSYVRSVTDHVNETAAALREEAKRVFLQIENTALMTKEMRDLSEQMRGRVAGAPSTAAVNLVAAVEDELDKARENGE